jgi:hypothetical protein
MVKKKLKRIDRGTRSYPIRCSKEFLQLVNEIRAKHLLNGKIMPTYTKTTQMIAKKIKENGGYVCEDFFRF